MKLFLDAVIRFVFIYFAIKLEGMALYQTRPSQSGSHAKFIVHPLV